MSKGLLEFILNLRRWAGGDKWDVEEPTAIGEGYAWTYNGRFYSILYTRAGMYRGNHLHPVDQHTILLEGKGSYIMKRGLGEVIQPLEVGKVLTIKAGIPHIFLPEEDCLTLEWWDGMFEAKEHDFPKYMKEIKPRIDEFNRRLEELKNQRSRR
ncbi:MAG: hypothetical protein QW638_07075 [Candidatus Bathyarchaeia archaeon]|nr:hypothetical protein [Candidatus Bathyarchaeota archaeon]